MSTEHSELTEENTAAVPEVSDNLTTNEPSEQLELNQPMASTYDNSSRTMSQLTSPGMVSIHELTVPLSVEMSEGQVQQSAMEAGNASRIALDTSQMNARTCGADASQTMQPHLQAALTPNMIQTQGLQGMLTLQSLMSSGMINTMPAGSFGQAAVTNSTGQPGGAFPMQSFSQLPCEMTPTFSGVSVASGLSAAANVSTSVAASFGQSGLTFVPRNPTMSTSYSQHGATIGLAANRAGSNTVQIFASPNQPFYTQQQCQQLHLGPQNTVYVPVAVQMQPGGIRLAGPGTTPNQPFPLRTVPATSALTAPAGSPQLPSSMQPARHGMVPSSMPGSSAQQVNVPVSTAPTAPLLSPRGATMTPMVQRQQVAQGQQPTPVFVGQFGTAMPTAGLAAQGMLPYALRGGHGLTSLPFAGQGNAGQFQFMTTDGHIISPQAFQMAMLQLQQQQQQQQQQQLFAAANQNALLYGAQPIFVQPPMSTVANAAPADGLAARYQRPPVTPTPHQQLTPLLPKTVPSSTAAAAACIAAAATSDPSTTVTKPDVDQSSIGVINETNSIPDNSINIPNASLAAERVASSVEGIAPAENEHLATSASAAVTTGGAPTVLDRQTARVRPRILTHVIEGFVIQEASEPFPVHPSFANSMIESSDEMSDSTGDERTEEEDSDSPPAPNATSPEPKKQSPASANYVKCRCCGQRFSAKYRLYRGRKFCSQACLRKYGSDSPEPEIPTSPEPRRKLTTGDSGGSGDRRRHSSKTVMTPEKHIQLPVLPPEPVRSHSQSALSEVASAGARTPPRATLQHSIAAALPVAASPSRRRESEDRERRLSTVITPPYSLEQWTVTDVYEFVRSLPGCGMYADEFRQQEIDGSALMLLKEDHLMSTLGVKLGPALKICSYICELRDRPVD